MSGGMAKPDLEFSLSPGMVDTLRARINELQAELAALKARKCTACIYSETCDQTEWPTDDSQVTLTYCSAWQARP